MTGRKWTFHGHVCIYLQRKKERKENYLCENKIDVSLGETKTDLCTVIYRKWLEADRRE